MRLRRPLPAVQGDTLHIVGVGDNRIGKDESSKEEYFDDHKDIEGLDSQGATTGQSDKDFTVDLERAAKRDPGPSRGRR